MKIIPGFRITFGITVFYLSLIVLIPLMLLVWNTTELKWADFVKIVTTKQVIASYKLTFTAAFLAALCNAVFGFMTAWSLVRYNFFGKKFFDAMIDLPFAMPTAVSGIALTALFVDNGWLGYWFDKIGIKTAFSPIGIFIALTFIGLPFVVRTLQPALEDLDAEIEEAAASLGATKFQTFWRVIFPSVLPVLLTGFVLAFARALGEYGSVVFISGNIPMETEITPLLIFAKLQEFNYPAATAISVVMLAASFTLMLSVNVIQWWARRVEN